VRADVGVLRRHVRRARGGEHAAERQVAVRDRPGLPRAVFGIEAVELVLGSGV
jgi:hypothetical protein